MTERKYQEQIGLVRRRQKWSTIWFYVREFWLPVVGVMVGLFLFGYILSLIFN